MKKTLITAALLSLGVYGVLGQGAINFNNRAVNSPVVVAPIYGPEPGNQNVELHGNATTNGGTTVYHGVLLSGSGFTAQLWSSPQGGALTPLSTTVFRGAATPTLFGFVVPPTAPIVQGVPGGASATFDLRVWDNQNGTITLWSQVMANPTILHGNSGTFSVVLQEPPTTPPNMVGLTSFNVFAAPEPSVIALGALGLGALLLRRRKA